MDKEFTQEESDQAILQEMGLAEDDSTINDEEESEEETTEEESEELESEEEETEDESDEEEEANTSKKPKGKIPKLLKQRNEARQEAEQAKSEVQTLKERLEELEANWDYGNEEYIQTLVDKRNAERDEVTDFFDDNSEIREYKKDIIAQAKELWLPIERAAKLFLAENAPNLLLEKTERNKQKSKIYNTPMQTSKKLTKGELEYSQKEFEEKARKGEITF